MRIEDALDVAANVADLAQRFGGPCNFEEDAFLTLAAEVRRLINVAGEALGTDPEMRSVGCVDALASWGNTMAADRAEAWRRVRGADAKR